jgi:hypothetical protein
MSSAVHEGVATRGAEGHPGQPRIENVPEIEALVSIRFRIQNFRSMHIRMRIRIQFLIQGSDDQKWEKIFS